MLILTTSSFLMKSGTCTVIPVEMVTGLRTLPAVSPRQGFGGFDDRGLDRGGEFEPDRFVIHQKNVIGVSLDQEAIVLTDHGAVEDAVLVGFQIHEVVPVRILVTVLELLRGCVHELGVIGGTELGGGGGPGAGCASGLHEPGLPALGTVQHFKNEVRGALVDDDATLADVCG